MSDRPTPETDASRGYALSSHYGRLEGSYLQMDRSGPFVHAEVARKLERERDEAREQIEVCRGIIERTVTARNSALSDLTDLERERDEAMVALASREVVIAQQNVITDLMLERDEARAVASELSDIASKHLSFLLAITPTRPNDTHEKETEKVIDALKRWKKL